MKMTERFCKEYRKLEEDFQALLERLRPASSDAERQSLMLQLMRVVDRANQAIEEQQQGFVRRLAPSDGQLCHDEQNATGKHADRAAP
jgi:hypothetical protein